jgi:cytochrome b561
MPSPTSYSRTQILLHWGVALLIVPQFILEDSIGAAWRAIQRGSEAAADPLVAFHVYGGIAILALVVWRLVLRAWRGVPPPPANESALMVRAAEIGHRAIYAVLIALPLSGLAAWFGGVAIMADVHEVITNALLAVVGLHIAAALWHQFWLKDGLMERMRPGR